MLDDLETKELTALIARLMTTEPLSKGDAQALNSRYKTEVFERMWKTGGTYGEAAGGLEFLNQPDAPAYVRSIKDDLLRQIKISNDTMDYWFEHGEAIPPHYFNRIAVILRKRKELEAEKNYMQALALHFYGSRGRTWEKMSERMEMLGVVPPVSMRPIPHHL